MTTLQQQKRHMYFSYSSKSLYSYLMDLELRLHLAAEDVDVCTGDGQWPGLCSGFLPQYRR